MIDRGFSIRLATWRDDQLALQAVRLAVFVAEQKIDPREEFDDVDPICQHVLAIDLQGTPIGTSRIDAQGKIGRMAVLADWRKAGVGRALLQKAIAVARSQEMRRVYLFAQLSATGFYEREGFSGYGECFPEAGIDHRAMELML